MTAQLPKGTVTFLFTDIEGSTQLWDNHPLAMQAVLAQHDALLSQAIAEHGGQIVKRTGDGCHAVFAAAIDGAHAALAAQQALAAEAWTGINPDVLKVRMSLHTGEADAREGDYFGPALNRAARLMAVGQGGQVLLSYVTASLVRDQLPAEVTLSDLGNHRLKDLTRPEHVFQLNAPGRPADFAPLPSLDAAAHNLPMQLTDFIGRTRELADVRRLLNETALLTLTGSGGTGKTRLSLQVAAENLSKYADGAWLVELAPVTDPALVLPTIAAALGVRQQPSRPLVDALADFLRGRQLLLILDNCEHLILASAQAAEWLLHQCPRLKIMASSREALGVAGETSYPVPSLSLPEMDQGRLAANAIIQSEAARLFVDRAQAALPSFRLDDGNAGAVALICRRLDGIPLAIELAAARVRVLSVDQIAVRLDDRFRLLTGGSRTALPRQQTLRALIDWSYALLSEPERDFLQRLSVFAGGWDLAAAEALGDDTADTLELLTQLSNKSLVVVDHEAGDQPRYRLLETIRQYAREKLFEAGDSGRLRSRHLHYFLQYAVDAQPALYSRQMAKWLTRFHRDHDNFRVAMEWALETDVLAAMQLAEALAFYMARRASTAEGVAWLTEAAVLGREAIRTAGERAPAYQRALARYLTARAMFDYGLASNPAEVRAVAEEATHLARLTGDTLTLSRALAALGMTTAFWGDPAGARLLGEEGLALARGLQDSPAILFNLAVLGVADQFSPTDMSSPLPWFEESLLLARAIGNPWSEAVTTLGLARVVSHSGDLGDLDATRTRYGEAMRLFAELGDVVQVNSARSDLAHALRRWGQVDEAVALYAQTLRAWQRAGAGGAIAHQLESLASIALHRRQPRRASQILGAAEALRAASSAVRMSTERAEYDQIVADLRAQLPAPEIEAAWAEGRAMEMAEAVEYALEATQ